MSIRYLVNQDRHLLLTVIERDVSIEDLSRYVDLTVSECHLADFNELIIVDNYKSLPASSEISGLAQRANTLLDSHDSQHYRTAIVAPSNLSFGLARVYQSRRTRSLDDFAVFKELKQAAAWLGLESDFDIETQLIDSEQWTHIQVLCA